MLEFESNHDFLLYVFSSRLKFDCSIFNVSCKNIHILSIVELLIIHLQQEIRLKKGEVILAIFIIEISNFMI